MKKKSHLPSIKEIIHQIELFNAENNQSKTNRVRYYKDKIKELGANEKKYFIPFKHRLLVNTRKKEERKKNKEQRVNAGLIFKKKR